MSESDILRIVAAQDLSKRAQEVLDRIIAERDALRSFAQAIMEAADWPDGGDVDGFQVQELAEEHGLLVKTEQTKPCGENCSCLEYNGEVSEKWPAICYRKTPLLTDSQAQREVAK